MRWRSPDIPAAWLPTCIVRPFVYPLHTLGSVERCKRHTRSKQEWGQAWGLQRLLETGQRNGMQNVDKGLECVLGDAPLHLALCSFVTGYSHPGFCVGDGREIEFQLPSISP